MTNTAHHNTRAIILRAVKYAETSLIITAFTQQLGLQSYIVKGIRQQSKGSKLNYFLPGSLLLMQVYNNPTKQLQFIKEYSYSHLPSTMLSSVVKNAVATFMVELLLKVLKHPNEPHEELFLLSEDLLITLDNIDLQANTIAYLPHWYVLKVGELLGFALLNNFDAQTAQLLHIQKGYFVNQNEYNIQSTDYCLSPTLSLQVSHLLQGNNFLTISNSLNKLQRQQLLQQLLQYLAIHIDGFTELKSVLVLQQVLG